MRALNFAKQGVGNLHLAQTTPARQGLDAVQGGVAGGVVLGSKQGIAEHALHQRTALGHNVGPIGVANGAQRIDRIAHTQVVRCLLHADLRKQKGELRNTGVQPRPRVLRQSSSGPGFPQQALAELRQKNGARTTRQRELIRRLKRECLPVFDGVRTLVGQRARRLVCGKALR